MITVLHWLVVGIDLMMIGGTLLSLSRHPHWFIRGWDFPRIHIAALIVLSGGSYALLFSHWRWYDWLLILASMAAAIWQCVHILPYLPLVPVRVKRASKAVQAPSLRLLAANVLMQNRQYDRFVQLVKETDPDVILAVEVDQCWLQQLGPLAPTYPYQVCQPQDNMYGMVLLSRLPLVEPQVRFLVQDDIPSIHTGIELGNGTQISFYGLHPRPPEPLRNQDSVPRDAELVLVGRDIGKDDRPTIVAGDLNDVAWSATSTLFLRLSRLLDPRMGRGLYSTFNANCPIFRFPLDHVFHSNCFTLVDLRRLPHIGSDHFPLCMTLQYEPTAAPEQPEPVQVPDQEQDAEEKIIKAEEEEGPLPRQ